MSYRIPPLDAKEYRTFLWLIDHGYAGDFGTLEGERNDADGWNFDPIPEHVAWGILDSVEDNQEAFLACNGSSTLAEKLHAFLESIV